MSDIQARLIKYLKLEIVNRSLRTCSHEIGISHATLSRVLSGCSPSLDNFRKIVSWLGMSADYILCISFNDESFKLSTYQARTEMIHDFIALLERDGNTIFNVNKAKNEPKKAEKKGI